jgi:hypothetical protein
VSVDLLVVIYLLVSAACNLPFTVSHEPGLFTGVNTSPLVALHNRPVSNERVSNAPSRTVVRSKVSALRLAQRKRIILAVTCSSLAARALTTKLVRQQSEG